MEESIIKPNESTPDLNKIKELALKILELKNRGDDHEREVATEKLEALLLKYNLTFEDIVSKDSFTREFKLHNLTDCIEILSQCIWDVKPTCDVRKVVAKKIILADLTHTEFIEVTEKYKFYWELYTKQKEEKFKPLFDEFLVAFIVKNQLGINNESFVDEKEQYTEEKIESIASVASSIEKGDFTSEQDESKALKTNLLDDSDLGKKK